MANVDGAFGFQYQGEEKEGLQEIGVDASNASRIGKGDPIIGEADGYAARAAAGSGVSILGIAQTFKDSNGKPLPYLPASTAGTIGYSRVKGKQFTVQADSGTALDVTAVNATADLTVGDCNVNTGQSIYELDSSNVGTGNTLRIIGLANIQGNAWGEHAVLIVEFVENAFDDSTSI